MSHPPPHTTDVNRASSGTSAPATPGPQLRKQTSNPAFSIGSALSSIGPLVWKLQHRSSKSQDHSSAINNSLKQHTGNSATGGFHSTNASNPANIGHDDAINQQQHLKGQPLEQGSTPMSTSNNTKPIEEEFHQETPFDVDELFQMGEKDIGVLSSNRASKTVDMMVVTEESPLEKLSDHPPLSPKPLLNTQETPRDLEPREPTITSHTRPSTNSQQDEQNHLDKYLPYSSVDLPTHLDTTSSQPISLSTTSAGQSIATKLSETPLVTPVSPNSSKIASSYTSSSGLISGSARQILHTAFKKFTPKIPKPVGMMGSRSYGSTTTTTTTPSHKVVTIAEQKTEIYYPWTKEGQEAEDIEKLLGLGENADIKFTTVDNTPAGQPEDDPPKQTDETNKHLAVKAEIYYPWTKEGNQAGDIENLFRVADTIVEQQNKHLEIKTEVYYPWTSEGKEAHDIFDLMNITSGMDDGYEDDIKNEGTNASQPPLVLEGDVDAILQVGEQIQSLHPQQDQHEHPNHSTDTEVLFLNTSKEAIAKDVEKESSVRVLEHEESMIQPTSRINHRRHIISSKTKSTPIISKHRSDEDPDMKPFSRKYSSVSDIGTYQNKKKIMMMALDIDTFLAIGSKGPIGPVQKGEIKDIASQIDFTKVIEIGEAHHDDDDNHDHTKLYRPQSQGGLDYEYPPELRLSKTSTTAKVRKSLPNITRDLFKQSKKVSVSCFNFQEWGKFKDIDHLVDAGSTMLTSSS